MITFENVSKKYPDGTVAVAGLSLEAPDAAITVLVGPSGCGKTTSLRPSHMATILFCSNWVPMHCIMYG